MSRRLVSVLCLCLITLPSYAQTQDAPVDTPAVEQVRVVAQRPGPGMWKVSRGEHTLWVFGTYSPMPHNIEWRSAQVEAAIARSSEYLAPPGAQARLGILKGLTLLPSMIGLRKNPNGQRLSDLLPPEQYARWTQLKAKYLPDDDVERERPVYAAETLVRAATKQAGLTGKDAVEKRIAELVGKHKLKQTSATVDLPMDNARTILSDLKKTSLNDVECLVKTMANLDRDVADAGARANAWARGNIDEIRSLDYAERDQACFKNIIDSAAFASEPAFRNMRELMNQKWLAAAEQALASNSSTFAVLPIKEILDPNGVVAALAARGYTVEAP